MGYDMYWHEEPDALLADEVAEARRRCDELVADRNRHRRDSALAKEAQRAVEAAFEAKAAVERNYFRLNIWGMQIARAAMERRGMVHEHGRPTDEEWDVELKSRPDDEDLHDEFLGRTVEHPGIAYFKLCSNDGWWIKPIEIVSALKLYAESCEAEGVDPATWMPTYEGEDVEWWPAWLAFLSEAVDHGGVRVY